MNTTLIRLLSAIAFLLIAFVVIYFFRLDGFKGLVLLVVLIIQTEYTQLVFKELPYGLRFFVTSIYFLIFYVIGFLNQYDAFWQSITLGGIATSFLMMVRLKNFPLADQMKYQGLFYMGFFYVGLVPSLIILILNLKYGLWVLFCSMVTIFVGDIFAYFVGRKWGTKKLFPPISPNKSWAGAWGGLVSSFIFGIALLLISYQQTPQLLPQSNLVSVVFITCCLLGSIAGQAGDFFESLIKRSVNEKDSGRILPGHGGLLDRFDALLFSIPVFYWFAKFINNI